jgi:hypothetical protein
MRPIRITALAVGLLLLATLLGWVHYARVLGRFRTQPALVLPITNRDIGAIIPGRLAQVEFPIRNGGRDTLILSELQWSCGCTSAELTTPSVGPGAEIRLLVRMRAPHDPGTFAHSVSLRTNDPLHPEATFTFSGRATWPIEVEPVGLRFRADARGEARPLMLEVFSGQRTPFEVRSIASSDPRILVEPIDEASTPYRRRFRVSVQPPEGQGLAGAITIETSVSDRPSLLVPVTFEAVATETVSPSQLMLRPTKAGSVSRATFLVSGPGERSVEVDRIEATGEGWSASHHSAREHIGPRRVCVVELKVPDRPGYSRSALQFFDPDGHLIGETMVSVLVSD